MLTVRDLVQFGAPEELVNAWATDLAELTDVQEQAVRAGAFEPTGNLLIVAPTSSGKTFIGEMAAAGAAFSGRRHGIFLVPYRALADEHFRLFRKRYGDLLSIAISTADWNEFDDDIVAGNFNLAVMTYEKLQSFLVSRPDLVERCGAVVIDEVQSLAEPDRGANLELLITRVLRLAAPPKIVALSASLDQINGLDAWMRARLVISHERPVPLHEMVCDISGVAIGQNADGSIVPKRLVEPQADREELLAALARSLVGEDKQIVIFRSTVRQVGETATRMRAEFRATGLPAWAAERLSALDDSESVSELRLGLASGVAFHHADLTHEEREIVEDAFRSGDVHTLVATTTLAMGVNLPCDAVIVAETSRWVPDRGGFRLQMGSVATPTARFRSLLNKRDLTADEAKALVRTRCLMDWMAGTPQRDITRYYDGMGAAASRVRDLGKFAAWLLESVTAGAVLRQASPEQVTRLRHLSLGARYGLPHELGRLARLRVQGVTRDALLRLFTANPELADPEALLDASDEMIGDMLTPLQLGGLRAAILEDYRDSVRRLARGQVARAEQASLQARLVQDLYETRGAGFEAAVSDAMIWAGLASTRILRQPHGEEDIQLAHADGTIVISVTASDDDLRPIRWNKAKEVLGTGAGMNPTNFVCIGRPAFDQLAIRRAHEIAREAGPRSILLIPLPVFADAIVRIAEKRMTHADLGDLLARASGLLELPDAMPHAATAEPAEPRAALGQ